MEKSKLPKPNFSSRDEKLSEKLAQQLAHLREDKEQIKYEFKRKIEIFEANEKSYTDEIEYWKGEHDKIKRLCQSQSNQFEEEKIRVQNIHDEESSALSQEIHKWELENEKLMRELKNFQDKTIAETNDLERIHELEIEILNLKEKLDDSHRELNLSEKKCNDLDDRNMALIQENEEYKQSLDSKREEVRKSNELIMELQDEIAILKKELDELQNQPRDVNARGNSLFAEVYDSRNQIKEKFLDLAERYQRVNKEKESLSAEVDILRKETATLREIFDNDIKNFQPGNMFELSGDSASMSAMRTLVESYKEEIDRITEQEPPAEREFQYYEAVIERQKRELEKLRGTLGDHTLTHSMRARKVSELGITLAFWKSKASEFESEKRFLMLKIQELEHKLLDAQSRTESDNSKKIIKKKEMGISKRTEPEKDNPRIPKGSEKEKNVSELYGSHKITIISQDEMKALMENRPYPAKESGITSCSNDENKENNLIQTKVGENLENPVDNREQSSEAPNESERASVKKDEKKIKKSIQFSDNTKKEDGENRRPRGKNRYVFNFQVKKLD